MRKTAAIILILLFPLFLFPEFLHNHPILDEGHHDCPLFTFSSLAFRAADTPISLFQVFIPLIQAEAPDVEFFSTGCNSQTGSRAPPVLLPVF